jgi:hypothetical protein
MSQIGGKLTRAEWEYSGVREWGRGFGMRRAVGTGIDPKGKIVRYAMN